MKKFLSIILAALMLLSLPLVSFAEETTAEAVELTDIEGVTFSASGYAYYPNGNRWNKEGRAFYKAFDNNSSSSALIRNSGVKWYQINLPAPAVITEVSIETPSASDYWSGSRVKLSKDGNFDNTANGNTVDLGAVPSDTKKIEVPQEYSAEKYSYIRLERNVNFDFQIKEIHVKGYPDEADLSAPDGVEERVLSTNSAVQLASSKGAAVSGVVNDGNSNSSTTIAYTDADTVVPEGGAWISMRLPYPARLTEISVDANISQMDYGFYIEAYNSKNPGTYEVLNFRKNTTTGRQTITFDVKNTKEYDYIRIREGLNDLTVYEITASGYAVAPEIIAECNIADGATNVSNPNLTEKVTVTFNQAMDSDTFNGTNVRLRGSYDYVGQYTVADNRSISFDIKNLMPYTTYTLTVRTGIKNADGESPSADEVLATFTTGNINISEYTEETILKNVSLEKTITTLNTFNNVKNVVNGETNNGSDGKGEFTIDLGGAYAVKAVDFFVNNGWGSEHKNWEVYGHNEETTDLSEMTAIEYTLSDADNMVTGVGKYRIILDNDTAYKYITLKRSSHHLYELSVWAPVAETLGTHNFDISALDISGDVANGFNAVANINNLSEEEAPAPKLIIAAYNGEALEAVTVSEIETMDAKTNGEITVEIPATKLAGKTVTNVKLFIFTNLNDITPVIKVKQLNITE